jgi:hypothetical protein
VLTGAAFSKVRRETEGPFNMALEAAYRLDRFNGWFWGAPRLCQTAKLGARCCQPASTHANGRFWQKQPLQTQQANDRQWSLSPCQSEARERRLFTFARLKPDSRQSAQQQSCCQANLQFE